MGEAAFGKIEEMLQLVADDDELFLHEESVCAAFEELSNMRKLLEAADDLLAAHHHSDSDDYIGDVRALISACRPPRTSPETGARK